MLGLMELVIIVFVFGSLGVWAWGLVDVLKHSEQEWRAIGQDRTTWMLVIMFAGVLGAAAYVLAVRPKWRQLALAGPPVQPMLAAAPGWYPDPSGAPMMRWFDGRQWTPQTAPMAPTAGAPQSPPQ